ncbi:acyltransferase family protein [Leifsonia sp. YIM 134122]|uniref:Acyltransferase family protein n=1 Tax=Leifsonia stereocauli TaxID=3134136 RepID=A0ABU9W7N5_9MICO
MRPSTMEAEAPRTTTTRDGRLPELQALRTVAVLLVVLYHLWPAYLQGGYVGVDVFLVISGYLISSHIMRGVVERGSFSLTDFYVRRIRRLLPAALVVLMVVGITTLIWMPQTTWNDTGQQIVASAFYVENWALVANSVDYLGAAASDSSVQHYWSLSVEEQFYLVWPLLLLLSWALLRRANRSATRRSLGLVVGIVGAASLLFSILSTDADQASAYFNTFGRIWEFAAGALLAVFLPLVRLRPWQGILSTWVGLAAILFTAVVYTSTTPFPGWTALLPVFGAAAVIAGGSPPGRFSLAPAMRWRPVQVVGDISYSVYLWHWPLIVIVPVVLQQPLGGPLKVAILIASLGVGWLSKRFLEDPLRAGPLPWRRAAGEPRRRTIFIGALCGMLIVSSVGGVAWASSSARIASAESAMKSLGDPLTIECFGASALADSGACPSSSDTSGDEIYPDPLIARRPTSAGCQQANGSDAVRSCDFGSSSSAAPRVALAGDSHASQWLAPLSVIADDEGWHLETFLRAGCFLQVLPAGANGSERRCSDWNAKALREIVAGHFDVVFVSARSTLVGGGAKPVEQQKAEAARMRAAWAPVIAGGARVVVLRDIAQPSNGGIYDAPTCVLENEHSDAAAVCSVARERAIVPDPQVLAAQNEGSVDVIDMNDFLCTADRCSTIVGDVLVYGDGNHLTALYATTLAPYLAEKVAATGSL